MFLYLFLLCSFFMITMLFMGLYFYYKGKKALQSVQQSAYDNKRIINFIKDNYKYTFGINELLPLLGVVLILINPGYIIPALLIMMFFMYYNVRFFNINSIRYKEKLKLNVTARVKRLIITSAVLTIPFIVLAMVFFSFASVFLAIIILTYLIYPIIMLALVINQPIEKHIREGYKKTAQETLKKHSNLEVIGVTGSYGKTSIKNIVGEILNEFEPTLITPESYNTPMGLTITVNNHLNVFHKNFIAEMGAYYEGEIKELCDLVSPKIGIVSSIGNQHLETFKNIETIQRTKMELVECLPSDGLAILNYDNEYIREYKIKNNVEVKYYSLLSPEADLYAKDLKIVDGKYNFVLTYDDKDYLFETKLLGSHNVENILAAILVCLYKGIDITSIQRKVASVKPIAHRLEYKFVNSELSILDDAFNSNTRGIKEAINVLETFNNKQRIVITPGLIDLGVEQVPFHEELGQYFYGRCDYVYVVGKYNKKTLQYGIENSDFEPNNVKYVDNFVDAYNSAVAIKGEKVILIANDLPDKFNN